MQGREHRACHQCRSNFGVKGTKSCKNNSEGFLYLPVHTPIGVETGINFRGTSIAKPNHKNQPNSNPFRIIKTRLDSNQEKAIHFQKSSQCIHWRKKQQHCIHRWPINTEATYESKEQMHIFHYLHLKLLNFDVIPSHTWHDTTINSKPSSMFKVRKTKKKI